MERFRIKGKFAKSDRPLLVVVGVKMSTEERETIMALAGLVGMTKSQYMRTLAQQRIDKFEKG